MFIVVHRVLAFTQEIKDVKKTLCNLFFPLMIDKLTENNKITILSYKIKTIEKNNFKLNNGFLPMSLPKVPNQDIPNLAVSEQN